MADVNINPEVTTSLADISGERVQEGFNQNYHRHFWSALKNGHYRMGISAIGIAVPIAAATALAVCALPGIGMAAAPILVPAFIGIGTVMAMEGFGALGAASAARASGLAEKHAREIDNGPPGMSLKAYDDKLMNSGQDNHYEFPVGRDQGKFFSWKSGLLGGAVGAVLGMGIAHALVETLLIAPFVGAAPVALIGAAVIGAFGLTFGIDRDVLKSVADKAEAWVQGKLNYKAGPDLGRAQSQESDAGLAQHRLQRQEEMAELEHDYNERISWAAVTGRFKGFAAGSVLGVLAGAAVGAVALGVLTVALPVATLAPVAVAAMHALIPTLAAIGGMYGGGVMGEAGTEAGAEAAARGIDNEFERNRALRAQGITPPPAKEAPENWFSLKPAIVAGIVGLAVGAALTPVMGVAVAAILHTQLAAGTLLAVSSVIGGVIGGSYGVGLKVLKAEARPLAALYDKVSYGVVDPHGKAPVRAQAPATPLYEKITPEEAAQLDAKLDAGSGKSFTQNINIQQLQGSSAALTAGG